MAGPQPVHEGCCPRCGKRFEYVSTAQHKPFPFCSARCREIDLGNWLTERYVIPGPAVAPRGDQESETDQVKGGLSTEEES